MQIDPSQALSQFVGSLPTFIAVILAWMNSNSRASDLRHSLEGKIDDKFTILDREIKALDQKLDLTKEVLRAEFHRVEEVMDARLRHLEERER